VRVPPHRLAAALGVQSCEGVCSWKLCTASPHQGLRSQLLLLAGMDVLQFKVMARILDHAQTWHDSKLEELAEEMYFGEGARKEGQMQSDIAKARPP
jgi:hypothetical protein